VTFDQFVLSFVLTMREVYPDFKLNLTPRRAKILLRAYTNFLGLAPYPEIVGKYFKFAISNCSVSSVDLILRAVARKESMKLFFDRGKHG